MSEARVLVTGASGFVGSRLVAALIERGENVTAMVRAGSRIDHLRGYSAEQLQLRYADIRVESSVYAALAGCDRMYHVASAFKMWASNPDEILAPAEQGTRATLGAARKRKLKRVVVTGSVASLGVASGREPMDEEHEFNLKDPEVYILSKHRAQQVVDELADGGLPLISVLPSGIVGPGDWKPTPSGEGILQYLRWPQWLSFPVTRGGLNLVDVDDVVAGHIAAMDRGRLGEKYILGGEDVTFEQMFGTLSEISGLTGPKPTGAGMAMLGAQLAMLRAALGGGDPPLTPKLVRDYAERFTWVTSEKAERELGYEHRPARQSLTRAVRWFLEKGYVPEDAAARTRLALSNA